MDAKKAEPEIPVVGEDAVTGEEILANEARITDADGTMYRVENYDAAKSDAAPAVKAARAEQAVKD